MALVVTLVVFPVVIPATVFIVTLVMPLIGSLSAPFAVIGIEATDGQAEHGRADGQEKKTSFHIDSRLGLFDGYASGRKSSAFSEHAGRFRRNRCCLKNRWNRRFGVP